MSRPCSVCQDARRESIDQAILAGASIRNVAKQFTLPISNLFRHSKHLLSAAQEAKAETRRILNVEQQIAAANNVVLRTMSDAHHRGDGRLAMQAADRVLRQCEFVHTLEVDARAGELEQRIERLEQALQQAVPPRGGTNGVDHRVSVA